MRNRFVVAVALFSASVFVSAQQPAPDKIEEMITKFEAAVKGDNYAQMKDLVVRAGKDDSLEAYWRLEYQLESAISNKSDEDKAARLAVLEKLASLFSQEFKDRLMSDRLAYVKTLTPEQAVKGVQMQDLMREANTALQQAEKVGEKSGYTAAGTKYQAALAHALEIKDVFWELSTYIWLGLISDRLEEKFDSAYYYKRSFEVARDQKALEYIAKYQVPGKLKSLANKGLKDDLIDVAIPLAESKKKYTAQIEKLTAEAVGGTDSKPGAGAPGAAAGANKGALPGTLPPPANKHTMRIEWIDAEKSKYVVANQRPTLTSNLQANGHWYFWQNTRLSGEGKQTIMVGEHLFKNDKGKVMFDPDGPGKGAEERLKIAMGKPEPIAFKARTFPDGTKVDLNYVALEVPNKFVLAGFNLDLRAPGPNDPIDVRWLSSSAVSTKFDGFEVTVYDDSADGRFDTWGDDSVVVSKGGKPVRSAPLSRFLYVGDLLYEFKLDPNGQNMRFKPYDGAIALLQFDWVGGSVPAFMILEGLNENASFFLNLVDCKDKPMWVPPGEYKFRNGYFAFGEGDKRETIKVMNTKSTSFKVAEGALNKVPMGAAKPPGFTFTWKTETTKDKGKTIIALRGKDIKVFGCAGEEYMYFTTGVFRPTVKMRSGKEGAVFYDKQMKPPAREDLNEKRAWDSVIFFPKDIEVDKAVAGDVFVTLEADYPKLGKITSLPSQAE
jgi:hypothetical protein